MTEKLDDKSFKDPDEVANLNLPKVDPRICIDLFELVRKFEGIHGCKEGYQSLYNHIKVVMAQHAEKEIRQ